MLLHRQPIVCYASIYRYTKPRSTCWKLSLLRPQNEMALYRSPSLDSLSLQSWCEVWYLGTSFCKSTSHQPLEWLAFNTMLGVKILFRIQNQNFLALFLSLSLSLSLFYLCFYIYPSIYASIYLFYPSPFLFFLPHEFYHKFRLATFGRYIPASFRCVAPSKVKSSSFLTCGGDEFSYFSFS